MPVLRADYLAAAIFEPDSRDIDVHGLHQGYLRALKARGGVVVTDAEVEAIERNGRHWSVRTRAGDFTGAKLVNAAGAWADEIALKAGAEPVGLTPKRRTAFTIDPPAGAAIADWPLVNDVGAAFYFKPDAGQLLVSPADAAPSPPSDAQADEYELALGIDRLERATSIPVRKVNHKWAGLAHLCPRRQSRGRRGSPPPRLLLARRPGRLWLQDGARPLPYHRRADPDRRRCRRTRRTAASPPRRCRPDVSRPSSNPQN